MHTLCRIVFEQALGPLFAGVLFLSQSNAKYYKDQFAWLALRSTARRQCRTPMHAKNRSTCVLVNSDNTTKSGDSTLHY